MWPSTFSLSMIASLSRRVVAGGMVLLLAYVQLPQIRAYFDDLYIEDPNFKALVFLRSVGILEGYSDNTVRPDEPITRGEFAKLLVEGVQARPTVEQYHDCFGDVAQQWFAPYVCYAKSQGIVQGISANMFHPESKVTRAEAIKMTIVAFGMQKDLPKVTKSIFKDVTPADWFAPYVHRAALDNMYTQEMYALPNSPINRGGAAEILYRAMMMKLLGMPVFDEAQADAFLKDQFQIGADAPVEPSGSTDTENVDTQLAIYQQVLEQLRELHPNASNVELKDFIYGSIEGLAKEVGDPYTMFLRPQQSQDFTDSLNGELTGIGVEIAEDAKGIMVLNVLPSSPAEKAGMMPGDIVTQVNDTAIAGMDAETVIGLMRGDEGTSVTLHVERDGEEKVYTLQRAHILIPSVIATAQGNIEVIRLTQFGGDTAKELRDVLTALPANTKGIVLDLRNNGGGYMDAAQTIAGYFLPQGSEVFSVKDAKGNEQKVETDNVQLTTLPMTVLINEYSASAAEVVSGALRDDNRATLVGEKSFGKGTVQSLIAYTDGSMLRVTIAQWYTPKGDSVGDVHGNHNGLVPAKVVADDASTPADEQLDAAISLLPQ